MCVADCVCMCVSVSDETHLIGDLDVGALLDHRQHFGLTKLMVFVRNDLAIFNIRGRGAIRPGCTFGLSQGGVGGGRAARVVIDVLAVKQKKDDC